MGKLLIKGKLYNPIKVGDHGDRYEGNPKAECGDCGAKYGQQHLPGCDIERCPLCGRQLISCDCGEVYDIREDAKESDIELLMQKQLLELQQQKEMD